MKKNIAEFLDLDKTWLIKLLFFLSFITCNLTSFAAFNVKGKVVDENGNGLAGATVVEKGRRNTVSTAPDGTFSINIRGQEAVLLFSYVGFLSKEVLVKDATADLVVQLAASGSALQDVVVVGYGTQKKSSSTAAVSTVKGSQLAAVPAAN